jgi:peptidoglycan/LPS O-acetylase OafA/YrhL
VAVLQSVFDHYRKPRVLGLDLLRITASLSVIIYHGNAIRALGGRLGSVFYDDGFLAVDIFFVLSGWLLTRQVLRMRGSFKSTWQFARTFWLRRWARTLPPYWVVLIAMFFFGSWLARPGTLPPPLTAPWEPLGINSLGDLVRHALFLQTVLPRNDFGVSWSLVTEEWFYLLLPFVILLASRLRSWRWMLALALGALLLPTAIRTLLILSSSSWELILPQPIARFEGLVVGAMLGAASIALPEWETHVMPRRRWLFWLSLPLLVIVLAAGVGDSFWFRTIGLVAFSVCIGLLIPFLSQLRWWVTAPALAVMGTAFLSELTYPLYLVHTIVPTIHWARFQGPMRFVYFLLWLTMIVGSAIVLHLGIERPFLALRDRFAARAQPWKEPAGRLVPPAKTPVPPMRVGAPVADSLQPAIGE